MSNWAVAQKGDYVAIFQNLGSTDDDYGDGYVYDDNVNAYITTGVGGTALFDNYWSATPAYTGYSFSKSSGWMNGNREDNSYRVRPVLGF